MRYNIDFMKLYFAKKQTKRLHRAIPNLQTETELPSQSDDDDDDAEAKEMSHSHPKNVHADIRQSIYSFQVFPFPKSITYIRQVDWK